MKIKGNKGYVGIDITIALIVIVILLPTIIAISYNTSNSNNSAKRKTQATSIATFVIEDIKSVVTEKVKEYYEISDNDLQDAISTSLKIAYELEDEEISQTNRTLTFVLDKNNILYKVYVTLEDSAEKTQKIFKVEVEYSLGKRHEKITLNTTFIIK